MIDARPRSRKLARRRAHGDKGTALVEAALVLPFLIAILFGIIDFGWVFNDYVSVRQGGRDGLRQAIINPVPTNASTCNPTGTGMAWGANLVCYTKDRVGLDPNNTRVKIYFVPQASAPYFKNGEPVKVCVQYKTGSITGAYSTVLSGKVLDTEVESLIEQDGPTTFTGKVEETINAGDGFKAWSTICPDSL